MTQSLLNNKDLMIKIHEKYPKLSNYSYAFQDHKHTCDYSQVVYCNNDVDVVRCTLCGHEKVVRCSFDEDFD